MSDSAKGGGKGGGDAKSQNWQPSHNKWLVAVVVTLGAFMEVLDTTIVNVSLPHISGSLAVSYDDATWALTSYLLANGIVLVISGWLGSVFGRKRYFLICIAGFTICSFLCGIADSLGQLVIFRLAQGFFGGGLQPNQQSIILDTFPPKLRPQAFAVTAIATIVAPVLGPTLGGYLTDQYGWPWVFFINIPVGAATFFAVQALVEDPPWAKARPRGIDYVGLSLLTIGLGSLEVVMDRGEELDWFGSSSVIILFALALIGIGGAIAWLLYTETPVVDLRVFADRNFAIGCMLIACMACVLYASAVVIPQFAQQQLGYTATWAGLILSPGGLVVIVAIPIVGRLSKVLNTKYVIAIGFFIMGCSLLYSHQLSPSMDFWTMAKMRAFQTLGLGFMFVPISTVTFATLPRSANADASALFTMSRNYFGSLSISGAQAILTEHTQIRQSYLVDNATPLDGGFVYVRQQVQQALLSQGHAAAATMQGAQNWLYQQLHTQAAVLAYTDVFMVTAVLSFSVIPLCLLLHRPRAGAGAGPAH